MSVLIIRKHQRFAVVRKVVVENNDGSRFDGLLIEASLEGCRIGNIEDSHFTVGDHAVVTLDGFGELAGAVRWTGGRRIGLHLSQALHTHELEALLTLCRGADDQRTQASAYKRLRASGRLWTIICQWHCSSSSARSSPIAWA